MGSIVGNSSSRRRKSGSKVKSGCQSCKLRHVKCDQNKPTCKRCALSKRECIYADAFRVVIQFEIPSPSSNSVTEENARTALCPAVDPPLGLPLDIEGRSSFYYFRQKACGDLSSLLPVEFWNTYVIPMSALSQSVQYAIVALATQHRTFVEEKSATASVSGNLNHQRTYSLHNYGRAITSLNNKLVEASNETRVLEETLITCLLFICFNTLQGNDVATLTHLESGLRICSKYSDALQILSSEYAAGHGPIGQLTSTFKRLDLQAAFYLGSYQIKSSSPEFSLCPQLPPNRSMRVYSGFETLQRAKDCLEMLVLSATSFMRSMAEPLKYLREDKKTGLKYNRALYYRDMYLQRLQDWFESFQLSDSLQLSPIGDNDKMQLAKCRISYAVTLIALSVCLSPEETEYDQHLPFFFEILTNAESILGQSADSPEPCPGARPLFDLEMSLIHPLYFTALKCRDYTARYRSIDLLYKCGKEGVWDGEIMARISLHVVALEECERTTEIITGELQVPEDKRVCGTSLNVIRDGKMVWVECSTRRWFPREWGMSGIESDKIALRQELAAEYAWDFSETLLKW